MVDILKGLWKWILAILIILLLGGIILALRIFVFDRNYDGTADSLKNKNGSSSSSSSSTSSSGSSLSNGIKDITNATASRL